jgi:hypothetical protein
MIAGYMHIGEQIDGKGREFGTSYNGRLISEAFLDTKFTFL